MNDKFDGENNPFTVLRRRKAQQSKVIPVQSVKKDNTVVSVDIKAENQNGNSPFDKIRHEDEQGEFWLARELQGLLGYVEWRKFEDAIERAKGACFNVEGKDGVRINFVDVANNIKVGFGYREVNDYRLTRYACYLTAMNGDSRKPEIAAAQTYFAIRTRQAEVQEQKFPMMSTMEMISAIALHVDKVEKEQKRQADILQQQQIQQQELTATIEEQHVRLNRLEQSAVTIRNFSPPDDDIKANINDRVKVLAFKRKEEQGGTLGIHVSDIWSDIYRNLRSLGYDIDEELASFKDFWTSQKNRGNKMFTQGKINGFKKLDVISAVPDIRSAVRSILDRLQDNQEQEV